MPSVPKLQKRTCDNPDCNRKPKRKYFGYRTYRFCNECWLLAEAAFRALIFIHYGYRCYCPKCLYSYPKRELFEGFTVHHIKFRSQGGKNTLDNCRPWSVSCHGKRHS